MEFAYIKYDRCGQTDNKMEHQRNDHVLYATWLVALNPSCLKTTVGTGNN